MKKVLYRLASHKFAAQIYAMGLGSSFTAAVIFSAQHHFVPMLISYVVWVVVFSLGMILNYALNYWATASDSWIKLKEQIDLYTGAVLKGTRSVDLGMGRALCVEIHAYEDQLTIPFTALYDRLCEILRDEKTDLIKIFTCVPHFIEITFFAKARPILHPFHILTSKVLSQEES